MGEMSSKFQRYGERYGFLALQVSIESTGTSHREPSFYLDPILVAYPYPHGICSLANVPSLGETFPAGEAVCR